MMSESLLTGYFLFRTGRVLPSLVPDAAACEAGAWFVPVLAGTGWDVRLSVVVFVCHSVWE